MEKFPIAKCRVYESVDDNILRYNSNIGEKKNLALKGLNVSNISSSD